jgi:16S rRNA (guanine966-N2)-methyltransferase
MIRVLSGLFRYRQLEQPPSEVTRPTSQSLKETIFNILEHRFRMDWPKTVVLDAFAGSGSIGIEAASRGAEAVHFMENNHRVLPVLQANLMHVRLRAFVHSMSCLAPQRMDTPVHWIFLDPPYQKALVSQALAALYQAGWIGPSTLLTIECSRHDAPPSCLVAEMSRVIQDKMLYFGLYRE